MNETLNTPLFFPDAALAMETLVAGKVSRKIRAHGGGLMIVEIFLRQGAVGDVHHHPHEQICYCLEGEFEFVLDGQRHLLKAGDSVYVPPSLFL